MLHNTQGFTYLNSNTPKSVATLPSTLTLIPNSAPNFPSKPISEFSLLIKKSPFKLESNFAYPEALTIPGIIPIVKHPIPTPNPKSTDALPSKEPFKVVTGSLSNSYLELHSLSYTSATLSKARS